MRILFTVVFIAFIVSLSGCSETLKPSDLPALYPCTLTITQEGKPLAGAVIDLIVQDTDNVKYVPVQRTDEKGIAVMTTYGFDGVPAGIYKIAVTKNIEEETTHLDKDTGETIITDGARYRTVEAVYSDAATTPHKIEISKKGIVGTSSFDVGKAIKQKM